MTQCPPLVLRANDNHSADLLGAVIVDRSFLHASRAHRRGLNLDVAGRRLATIPAAIVANLMTTISPQAADHLADYERLIVTLRPLHRAFRGARLRLGLWRGCRAAARGAREDESE